MDLQCPFCESPLLLYYQGIYERYYRCKSCGSWFRTEPYDLDNEQPLEYWEELPRQHYIHHLVELLYEYEDYRSGHQAEREAWNHWNHELIALDPNLAKAVNQNILEYDRAKYWISDEFQRILEEENENKVH
jgi:hypothetical protein